MQVRGVRVWSVAVVGLEGYGGSALRKGLAGWYHGAAFRGGRRDDLTQPPACCRCIFCAADVDVLGPGPVSVGRPSTPAARFTAERTPSAP
jgi:hypothetical protein